MVWVVGAQVVLFLSAAVSFCKWKRTSLSGYGKGKRKRKAGLGGVRRRRDAHSEEDGEEDGVDDGSACHFLVSLWELVNE